MSSRLSVSQHRLNSARFIASPHHDERPPDSEIALIVVHGISLPAGQFGLQYINDLFLGQLNTEADPSFSILEGLRVSAHLLIRRTGEVIQYVPFNKRAWHAGVSSWQGRTQCNDFSIGIEMEGTDDIPYTDAQYAVLTDVVDALRDTYPGIEPHAVTGHEHIAPGRKTDPGPVFDWERLARGCSATPTTVAQQASDTNHANTTTLKDV
ncbi:MAG: 1,6-anhydro-N-acetylmuramyl-L-alanine amidase AmpD [Idiomarina sp.]|nr:1,6-anhydro-N-acetylmuramyl-L-alanine amidase AmpD [Idiomarina sp.]